MRQQSTDENPIQWTVKSSFVYGTSGIDILASHIWRIFAPELQIYHHLFPRTQKLRMQKFRLKKIQQIGKRRYSSSIRILLGFNKKATTLQSTQSLIISGALAGFESVPYVY